MSDNAIPVGAIPVSSYTSGAATSLGGFLGGNAGKRTYIQGIMITGLGATAATNVVALLDSIVSAANISIPIVVPAGATVQIQQIIITFPQALPCLTVAGTIGITVPSFGAGNTFAAVSMWGYNL